MTELSKDEVATVVAALRRYRLQMIEIRSAYPQGTFAQSVIAEEQRATELITALMDGHAVHIEDGQ